MDWLQPCGETRTYLALHTRCPRSDGQPQSPSYKMIMLAFHEMTLPGLGSRGLAALSSAICFHAHTLFPILSLLPRAHGCAPG